MRAFLCVISHAEVHRVREFLCGLFPMQSSTECVHFCVVISHAEFHRVRAFLCGLFPMQSSTECMHFCEGYFPCRVPPSACIFF